MKTTKALGERSEANPPKGEKVSSDVGHKYRKQFERVARVFAWYDDYRKYIQWLELRMGDVESRLVDSEKENKKLRMAVVAQDKLCSLIVDYYGEMVLTPREKEIYRLVSERNDGDYTKG